MIPINKIQIYRSNIFSILILIAVPFIFGQLALAQKEPEVNSQPYKINGKEVKEYLMDKYQLHKIHKDDMTSTLQLTPNGPSGNLYINSFERPITPQNITITDASVQGRARAIARAFLREETTLFGISNMDEIREMRIDTFTSPYTKLTTTNIHYRRYIDNLELKDMYIGITIGQYENIRSVSAELVPTPPELYEAVTKKTLSEIEILKIVEQDLESVGINSRDMRVLKVEKVVIPSPPYVIWKPDVNLKKGIGRWGYDINAFTGEIIKKKNTLVW